MSIFEQRSHKRSLVGCFVQSAFTQFPATYLRFFLTLRLSNFGGTVRGLDLTTRIEQTGSAHVVFSSSIKLPLGEERRFARTEIMAFSVPVPGITFPTPGTYRVLILLNGDEVGKRDINVLQVAT